ncbi:MAG: S8 family serine peptidase [Prochloraceae cyanobacterium]|nr:S8 family serine peptidase [Prochloraceae cyanobacterium]
MEVANKLFLELAEILGKQKLTQINLTPEKLIAALKDDREVMNQLKSVLDRFKEERKEIPSIEIKSIAELDGANSAFSPETNKIYLTEELVTQNSFNLETTTNVLLKEIEHSIEAQINTSDSAHITQKTVAKINKINEGAAENQANIQNDNAEFLSDEGLSLELATIDSEPLPSPVKGEGFIQAQQDTWSAATMAIIPSDPLFSSQWHLRNTTPGLLDLNVVDVWNDYTGAGVEVAVIDDAVQRTHADLDGNYSSAKDWDFGDNDTDPSGVDGDDHGTAVAGIIGANASNGIGGVGVAYGATIFGFGINYDSTLVQRLTTAIDNTSGLVKTANVNREADIVNMSLSTYNYFDVGRNGTQMAALNTAIDNAVISGRNGLGTILMKSAGNKRISNFDTNAMSWNANPHTISVAAVDQNGFVSSYSSYGASVLISAFGTPSQVVTTDRVGKEGYDPSDYTSSFNGTSASTPMASGVVALMLEANPNLGWRDVQEILAYSARHVGTNIGSGISGSEKYAWDFNGADNWNGGGLHFSNDYGFGLVDAKTAVRLAETWGSNSKTSANETSVFKDFLNSSITISNGNDSIGGTSFSQFIGSNIHIEHVEVDVNFTRWDDLGDLEIRLISPDGTRSILIDNSGENNGNSTDGFGSGRWEFYSNQFRGETTIGTWTVQLFDSDSTTASPITINDIDLTFYGQAISNNDNFIFTEEYSNYAGQFGHSTFFNGSSGTDTINAAAVDSNTTVNLTAGTGGIDGVGITISGVEDVITGDGNDTITGNNVNNTIEGNNGNDVLYGNNGNDVLYGGVGDDTFTGGNGYDRIDGGVGFDKVVYSSSIRGIKVDLNATNIQVTNDGLGEQDTLSGIEAIEGSNYNDTITGNNVNNTIEGNNGNDVLNGGAGNDSMYGGVGNDTFYVNSVGDRVFEGLNRGTDRVISFINHTLAANVENLTLAGNARNGVGNNLNNTLIGNATSNILNGAAGNDNMYGGAGNDTYYVNSFGDRVFEGLNRGTDRVISFINHTLAANVENLTLAGNTRNGVGNNLNNILIGNAASNILNGAAGNDILNGAGGNDIIAGAAGNDRIFGAAGNDRLIGGAGRDVLVGGIGADRFVFNSISERIDVISDFNRIQGDKIVINRRGFGATSTAEFRFFAVNGALLFRGQQIATLQNVNAAGFNVSTDIILA